MDDQRRRQEREANLDPENPVAIKRRDLTEIRTKPRINLCPSDEIMMKAVNREENSGWWRVFFYEKDYAPIRPLISHYKVMVYNGIIFHSDHWTLTEEHLLFRGHCRVPGFSDVYFFF